MFVVVFNLQVLQVPVMPPSITSELCDIIQIEYKLKVNTTPTLIIPTNATLDRNSNSSSAKILYALMD